jgi:hypothetical protein
MSISRRTALKALSGAIAAAFVPTVGLRPEVDREAVLSRFCAEDQYRRFELQEPFQYGSLTYATDGARMVRTELTTPRLVGERRLPNVTAAWNNCWHPTQPFRDFELPSIDSLTLGDVHGHGTCPECDDRRVLYGPSYPTDQESADALPDWNPDDNTIRDVSCQRCHGRPYRGPCRLTIGNVLLDYTRLKLVASIRHVQVAPALATYEQKHDCLLFRGDGFEGVLMGMWPQSTKPVAG